MLKEFFLQKDIPEVITLTNIINKSKKRIQSGDFNNHFLEFQEAEPLFDDLQKLAIKSNNESLANSKYLCKEYLRLFCLLSKYFRSLDEKQYRRSWDYLQDCLDTAYWIGQSTPTGTRYEIPILIDLLTAFESLYPFKMFGSAEMIISKSECSICGQPFQSLNCPHIKGHLYWGEVALEIVTEIRELQAVSLVEHPLDKRCVIEINDDERSEPEKFRLLDEFLNYKLQPLQLFSFEIHKSRRKNPDIVEVGRNDTCSCGSGKRFKECCEKKLYYKHLHYIIHTGDKIKLITDYT
jgi:hypothetical protein